MSNLITIIGIGEIGGAVLKEIARLKGKESVFGVDINDSLLEQFKQEGYNVGKEIPKSKVYIIGVYLTEQVFDVLSKIDCSEKPIVSIESTLKPGTAEKIIEWKKANGKDFKLVVFPHRFNPNDSEHHVFNLHRIIGAEDKETLDEAIEFFSTMMNPEFIHPVSLKVSELSKPVENTYRFMEISIAEQLKEMCEAKGIDFEELRKAASTKWNINIYEARDGIGGKCLPKDTQIINEYYPENELFKAGFAFNEKYRQKHAKEKL
jgi:UDP-N-acetyl-D-mannosaminuronic acid dehydrogenase